MTYRELQNALINIARDREENIRFQANLHGRKLKERPTVFGSDRASKVEPKEFSDKEQAAIDATVADMLKGKV